MINLSVKTDRMDITWALSSGYIFVQQRWRYVWIDESGRNPWTIQEKRDFHNSSDKWIWHFWSSKAYAMIGDNSKLAHEYRNTKFTINVDIRWVTGHEDEHWTVYVRKVNPNSQVDWLNRKLYLHYKDDIEYRGIQGRVDSTMTYAQVGVGHEFGHTFGNTSQLHNIDSIRQMHGDEYKEPLLSLYKDDASIMSVGNDVRQRHYDFLKSQLKNMINHDVEIYMF